MFGRRFVFAGSRKDSVLKLQSMYLKTTNITDPAKNTLQVQLWPTQSLDKVSKVYVENKAKQTAPRERRKRKEERRKEKLCTFPDQWPHTQFRIFSISTHEPRHPKNAGIFNSSTVKYRFIFLILLSVTLPIYHHEVDLKLA